jgi:hypothetical protein
VDSSLLKRGRSAGYGAVAQKKRKKEGEKSALKILGSKSILK